MDRMNDSGILSIVAVIVSVGTTVIGIINHKRIRSSCCGRKVEVSVDVEETTPPHKLEIKVPDQSSDKGVG
jgi:hypothetical protein